MPQPPLAADTHEPFEYGVNVANPMAGLREEAGRLDVLVNIAWGSYALRLA